ncbi:hypothetical protein CARUB_v10017815mg [Capsella rubella]|uniref:MATH domain-containing protein n=1 Tax=Capsella rubella TaxID=81985 RepID=R0FPW3_9BRAS|nr:MATH domain and coiled-coil domain-containing protein At3g27040 [Capsella rubella]EOA24557.1 hypothetical protein CARUB_v10017815mg [Capsella rubella]
MGNQADNKFTWMIKNFNTFFAERCTYSDIFVAGRCRWRLMAYPKGSYKHDYYGNHLSLYICVPDSESLPSGWSRNAKISFTIATQTLGELSHMREAEYWFDQENATQGFECMLRLSELHGRDNGLLVNGAVKVIAEVNVLEVIGKLDVPEEPKSIDIKGVQVLASQVESVNSLFEKYPSFASKLCSKNPQLQKTYLNIAQNLTEILCKSPEELSNGDLAEAYSALRFVTNAGFKLDWLEKKLKEAGKTRLHEIEQELKDLNLKCADMEALIIFLR